MSACAYAALAAGTAALEGTTSEVDLCDRLATFYVRVDQAVADGYVVEHLAKVCDQHDAVVNFAPGHVRSTPIRTP